jgi:putative zinc finger protein
MTCSKASADIQELLDGTLGAIRQSELRLHLDTCASCRALYEDLQRIREVAGSTPPMPPPDHIWLQIAGRLRQAGRVHDQPQAEAVSRGHRAQYVWLAIAATLVLSVGTSLLLVRGGRSDAPPPVESNAAASDAVQSGVEDLRKAEQLLQSGVAKLKEGLKAEGSGPDAALPSAVASTLDQNLQILDQAIAESSSALQKEPQNVAARNSLFDALQRKISLLQDTITLMNEMRKGNAAGVAQVVDVGNKS